MKDRSRRCEVEWEGDGVMYRATVMGYNSTTRRHNLLYDDGDREKINLEEVAHRWLDARGIPEGLSHPLSQSNVDMGGALISQALTGAQGKRGAVGVIPSYHQAGGGGKGGHQLKGTSYAMGGEMDNMASLLQAVDVVQGPGDDLGFEPQVGSWGQQQQMMSVKSLGRKQQGQGRQQAHFNSFLGHPQLPHSSGPAPRVKLDEALGMSLPTCPLAFFRTRPPPSSTTGRASCTSPKAPFGGSPPPTLTGASISSSAAIYRLQHHRDEVGSLLFDQGSCLSQLIKDAASSQGPRSKDLQHVNGMMGIVLNSQLLAAMPASSMNTVQLYRAYKFG